VNRLAVLAGALLAASPGAASAEVRALFVGVDTYLYSRTKVPDAGFSDLRGAVGDVGRIKAAFRTAYGLDLDASAAGQCRSANRVSVTLTDKCATRRAVLEALDERIAASARGDTLLFYFAGHGSRFADDQVFDQASGYNDTIMPTDAREPGAAAPADILDREIGAILDRAAAKGVNIVSIFDSCNSGTGARAGAEGVPRSAPPLVAHAPAIASVPAARGGASGYRVHLAAAADDEEAREIGEVGGRAGVFTSALVATLAAMPNATFRDIAAEVRLKVAEGGHTTQTPQAEGALDARFGGGTARIALLSASPKDDGVALAAGRLSGVTVGSTYALFGSGTEAVRTGGAPLATGKIAGVSDFDSRLVLDRAPAAPLPDTLFARETAHAFGADQLRVRIMATASRALAERAMAGLAFAKIGEPAQLEIVLDQGDALLRNVAGERIAGLGNPSNPDFAARLRDSLQKVARVHALLALRTDPAKAESSFCIAPGDYDVYACPPPAGPAGRVLKVGEPAKVAVLNATDEPRFVYVFGIDGSYAVTLLLPPSGTRDPAVGPRQPLQRRIAMDSPGRYRFVTIATDTPIDAAALEQDGAGARDPAACRSALERLLCDAATGTRDPSAPRVGRWTATVSSADVHGEK
jgi:hypothetical protein